MSKHTKGPWEVHYLEDGGFEIHDMPECWESTVLCTRYPFVERKEEFEANARLIAAAPELLEALKDALKTAQFEKHPFRTWHQTAKEAIKKATGEES